MVKLFDSALCVSKTYGSLVKFSCDTGSKDQDLRTSELQKFLASEPNWLRLFADAAKKLAASTGQDREMFLRLDHDVPKESLEGGPSARALPRYKANRGRSLLLERLASCGKEEDFILGSKATLVKTVEKRNQESPSQTYCHSFQYYACL
jgi:hypothetical protein